MRDADIRRVLLGQIRAQHRGHPETAIVEELGLRQGTVRIDLAVINGMIHGFEIKSAADTLRRLPTQASVYGQVLDRVTIVLAEHHRADAVAAVPGWWSVWVASNQAAGIGLECWRDGAQNPCIEKRALAELLWRDDAVALLCSRGLERHAQRRPRSFCWDLIADQFTAVEIAAFVRSRIRERAAGQAE